MKILKIFFSWLLVFASMIVIIGFSSDTPDKSNAKSNRIAEVVECLAYEPAAADTEAVLSPLNGIVRKCAHVFNYFLLSILCCNAFYITLPRLKMRYCLLFAWLLATLFSVADELYQTFIPGRSGEFTDVCIDNIGVLAGLLVGALLIRILSYRRFYKAYKKGRPTGGG